MIELADRRNLSRRETLKRGAVLGGATLWATPIVQSLTARPAFAQVSPLSPPGVPGPSFVALNVSCGGSPYFIKFNCEDTCAWEDEPGKAPKCDDVLSPEGQKANGGTDLGFAVLGPNGSGCVTVGVPSGCIVNESAIKKGQMCCAGANGTGTLIYCPCS